MDIKNKIRTLYQKLKSDTISRIEYEEFLSYAEDESLRSLLNDILDDAMKAEISSRTSWSRQRTNKSTVKRLVLLGGVAASIIILIVAGIMIWQPSDDNEILYSTSNGETMDILLPDSTLVKLNANSSLSWIPSKGEALREVKLTGEAFFDVYSMPLKPFRVYSNEIVIEVLGTSFNVNNRKEKDEVFLAEGSIRIKGQKNKLDTLLLSAGEAAFFNLESEKVVKTTDRRFEDRTKWKDGILKFRNLSVHEILEEVQLIYGVSLKLDDQELLEKPMDFALPYSNWNVVSKALALALGTELKEYEHHIEFVRK